MESVCVHCKNPMPPRKGKGGPVKRYCSRRCRTAGAHAPDPPAKPAYRGNVAGSEVDYAADEWEFIKAMDRYKRENRKPFPTWSEVYAVLKSLGYEKKEQP